MKLKKFLDRNTPKKDKIRILNQMLKVAKKNNGTISVIKARQVVKNG